MMFLPQTILLTNLGFGRAFVLQDHVAATFGAGLGKKMMNTKYQYDTYWLTRELQRERVFYCLKVIKWKPKRSNCLIIFLM